MYAKLKPEKRIISDIENHKIGDTKAGIAKRSIIPKHINAVAIHNGTEPRDTVEDANRPKRGS